MFHIFFPHTTGLRRPRRAKAFNTFEGASDAAIALNILNGTPDRIFIILSEDDLIARTNITDPLPFTESMFRFNRLSDTPDKFGQDNTSRIPLSLYKSNPHAAIAASAGLVPMEIPSSFSGKSYKEVIESLHIKKEAFIKAQASIQHKMGKNPFPPRDIDAPAIKLLSLLSAFFGEDLPLQNRLVSHYILTNGESLDTDPEWDKLCSSSPDSSSTEE